MIQKNTKKKEKKKVFPDISRHRINQYGRTLFGVISKW